MWCSCFKPSVLDIAIAEHLAHCGRDERINSAHASRNNSIEIEQTSRFIKHLLQPPELSRSHSTGDTARSTISLELSPAILPILMPLISNQELAPIIIPTLLPLIATLPELVPVVLPTLLPLIKIHPELAPAILQTLIPLMSTIPELTTTILPLLLPIMPLIETNPDLAPEILQTVIPLIIMNLEPSCTRKK